MHTTPSLSFYGHLGIDLIPHQNVLDKEEDLNEDTKTILHKKEIKLGMLSLLAWPFAPTTENKIEIPMSINEKRKD